MKNVIKNPWTTITGSILIVVSILTLYGVITQEQAASLNQFAIIIVNAIAGIIAVFVAKDTGGGI